MKLPCPKLPATPSCPMPCSSYMLCCALLNTASRCAMPTTVRCTAPCQQLLAGTVLCHGNSHMLPRVVPAAAGRCCAVLCRQLTALVVPCLMLHHVLCGASVACCAVPSLKVLCCAMPAANHRATLAFVVQHTGCIVSCMLCHAVPAIASSCFVVPCRQWHVVSCRAKRLHAPLVKPTTVDTCYAVSCRQVPCHAVLAAAVPCQQLLCRA